MDKTIQRLCSDGSRALVFGIGGGGDVVGALLTARYLKSFGVDVVLEGLSWERYANDPEPGPRKIAEIKNAKVVSKTTAMANPDTYTSKGVRFAESSVAEFLDEETLILDLNQGVKGAIGGLNETIEKLNLDFVIGIDVGGDVLARGDEKDLHSMLADSMVLAVLPNLEVPAILGVLGFGVDGELNPEELLENSSKIASEGGFLGARGLTPDDLEVLDKVLKKVKTESSALAAKSAKGQTGEIEIRGGYRKVKLSLLSAITFFFEPETVTKVINKVAKELVDTRSLDEAQNVLDRKGLPSELTFERNYVWKDYTEKDELFEG